MPHLSMEYSANVEAVADMGALCTTLHEAILATGLFELGAVRVRALRADHYAVGDLLPENGFVDMSFRIGTGRSLEDKKRIGEALIKTASKALSAPLGRAHFALSLEIREIDSARSWKLNTMHPRLRDTAKS